MEGGIKMKTYKTWEAIKMLTENHSLKFTVYPKDLSISVNNGGDIEWNYGDIFRLTEPMLNYKWVLAQQPVSFMEAVKASYKGKTIYCVLPQSEYAYISKIDKLESLTDSNGNGLSTQEILEGKWYIKEDEG